jgi:hypothetical protein
MPRSATAEPDNVQADAVLVEPIAGVETIEAPPALFDQESLRKMVSEQVSQSVVAAMQALLPEMLKTQQVAPGPNLPSQSVPVGMAHGTAVKPNYLKRYRRDGTVSGKYQMIDVSKLEDGDINVQFVRDQNGQLQTQTPAVQKGRWIHFVNDEFYATKQDEVDFIEWRIKTDPQFRVYEVTGAGLIACPIGQCGAPPFIDDQSLKNHLKATHGVDHA